MSLSDVALLNDALDVKADNERLAQEHFNRNRENGG